jgi:hypothetical protein
MNDELYPYSTRPEERVREFRPNDPRERAEGILIGFSTVLARRNGHIDIITTRNAVMEILDFAIAATKSEDFRDRIEEMRADMTPIQKADPADRE